MRNSAGYLSKREQQIMDLAYEHEHLTTALLTEKLPGSPAGSTVRTLLKILEEKGHLRHIEEDGKYIYFAINPKQSAAKQALAKVVQTFFKGSVSDVVAALLSDDSAQLTDAEVGRLQGLIEKAREEGK
jgi:predicted transcriptional regulator